mgnify:FL=1
MVAFAASSRSPVTGKLRQIRWGMVAVLAAIAAIGVVTLYSAGNGNMQPWAVRHLARFGAGLLVMVAVA